MMKDELDDIKAIWQKNISSVQSTEVKLAFVDSNAYGKTLRSIRKVLRIEFWLCIIIVPFILYYWYLEGVSFLWQFLYGIVTIAYLYYYQFLIRKTKELDLSQDVITSLKKIHKYLHAFLLHYKIVLWGSFIGGFCYGIYEGLKQQTGPPPNEIAFWLITLGLSIIILGVFLLITNFMINLIYGRKIKKLKKLIKELSFTEK